MNDVFTPNKCTTAKLPKKGYGYHKFRRAFSKFYRRQSKFVSKFNVGFNHFYINAYRNQEFHNDLEYKLKNRGITDFSDQFRHIIMRYKRIGSNLNCKRQPAC